MSAGRIYEIWCGDENPWRPWVKPSLFAGLEGASAVEGGEGAHPFRRPAPPWANIDVAWAPAPASTAIVVDLEGVESLWAGLALAARGYRPVVSINARSAPGEVIDMAPLAAALREGARHPLAFQGGAAPRPAFLLDARRARAERPVGPGAFDNRWVLFANDLPPADALLERGVISLLVVQRGPTPQPDLHDVLCGHEREGLTLLLFDAAADRRAVRPARLACGPALVRFARHIARELGSTNRQPDGSFGAYVKESR
ncbi:MAG TPA: hypothetical protein VFS43_13055 [Polyangiaceae bacterium]|nr:hypothetical protein [Polyangiaceae bacterium]